FSPRKPQDPRQDPVPAGMFRMQLRGPDLAGGPAPDEDGVKGLVASDLRPHDVLAARRAEAAIGLADAVLCSRAGIGLAVERKFLPGGVYQNPHRLPAKKVFSNLPQSSASRPPVTLTWLFKTCFFGSVAPYTTRAILAWNIAPRHMSQGSRVTYNVAPG